MQANNEMFTQSPYGVNLLPRFLRIPNGETTMFAILAAVALTVGGLGTAATLSSDNQFLAESPDGSAVQTVQVEQPRIQSGVEQPDT